MDVLKLMEVLLFCFVFFPLSSWKKLPIFQPDSVEMRCVALSSKSFLSAVKQPTVKHVRQHIFHVAIKKIWRGAVARRGPTAFPQDRLQISSAHHVILPCVSTPSSTSYLLFEMLINSQNKKRQTRRGGSADHYLPIWEWHHNLWDRMKQCKLGCRKP